MNPGEHPALPDQPSATPLDELLIGAGVPRSMPHELLQFAREADLRLDGTEAEPGDEGEQEPAETPPEGEPTDPETGGDEPSDEPKYTLDAEFDPSTIPEDADPEWFAERIKEMQADYTRKTQTAAEERREAEQATELVAMLQDERLAPKALALLGFDLDGDEEPGEGEEELLTPEEEVAQLRERLDQRERAEAEQEIVESENEEIVDALDEISDQIERELEPEEVDFLTVYALNHRDRLGRPDVGAAYKKFKGIFDKREAAYREAKTTRTARTPSNGKPGASKADLSTEEGRIKAAEEAAERAASGN